MSAIAKESGLEGDLEAADWRFYFEKAMAKNSTLVILS